MAFEPSGISPRGIVGRVVAPAEDKFNGSVTELRLAIDHGYTDKAGSGGWIKTSTTWLTYSASGSHAAPLKTAGVGDLVKISGNWSLETREYQKKDGSTGIGVGARFGDFEILEVKGEGRQTADAGFIPAEVPAGDGWL